MTALSSRSFALLMALLAGSMVGPVSTFAQDAVPVVSTVAVTESAPAAVSLASPAPPLVAGAAALWPEWRITWSPLVDVSSFSQVETPLVVQDRVRAGPNIAMMAVGGAALVVGLAMNSDTGMIIAATGGVIGLVGLYRYLR